MRYITALCSLLATGCDTPKAEEPKLVVVDICPPVSEPVVRTEKIYSDRVILPNLVAVDATHVEVENDHVRFCTLEEVMERSYIKVEEMEKLGGYVVDDPLKGAEVISITSKHHYGAEIFIRAEEGESVFGLHRYEFAIPTLRPLEEKCKEEGAKMYEILKQNDVIPYKDLKIIRPKD